MNNLDKQYTDLLQDILDNGIQKSDRTGTGTISIFGKQIRHKMSDGFPLLTTKKMAWKSIVTELLWFLRGDTNIKFLVDNGCNIWNGDAYRNYREKNYILYKDNAWTQEEFINKIKNDKEFSDRFGNLGPVYGKQWRKWDSYDFVDDEVHTIKIDQIANLIKELKTNPDSRRLMVNAWNVGELDQMVLPPCHYGFQVYTRELSLEERLTWMKNNKTNVVLPARDINVEFSIDEFFRPYGVPTRAISLMFNMRSNDVPLGLPFNIASYGLLLEIIAKVVNMVPDELIGNLGDTHIYLNQVEGIKEQIGRDLTLEERFKLAGNQYPPGGLPNQAIHFMNEKGIPTRTREPFPLPKLNINTEFWPKDEGLISASGFISALDNDNFIKCLLEEDIQLSNYQFHPTIKMPLSN